MKIQFEIQFEYDELDLKILSKICSKSSFDIEQMSDVELRSLVKLEQVGFIFECSIDRNIRYHLTDVGRIFIEKINS